MPPTTRSAAVVSEAFLSSRKTRFGFTWFGFRGIRTKVTPLRVIDEKGALTPQAREVIHLMHQRPAALASGHVSFEEIRAIQRYVKAEKLDIRLLVNHVQFTTPKLDLAQLPRVDQRLDVVRNRSAVHRSDGGMCDGG
jgi:hypothetical protein